MKKLIWLLAASALSWSVASSAKDLSGMRWDEVLTQAKAEKTVVWYQWYFQDRFRETVKSFEKQYGIKVRITEGGHQSNLQKLIVEKNRKQGDIDVISLSGSDLAKIKAKEVLTGPLKNRLPDGQVLRYKIEGVDNHGMAPAFWGNQTGIAYNPLLIAEKDLPQTTEDFSAYIKAHPGSFGLNAENGGSGPGFIQSIARNMLPEIDFKTAEPSQQVMQAFQPVWDWFNHRKSDYVITVSNIDSLNRVNGGELALAPAWEDQLAGLQKKGELSGKLKFYIPAIKMPGGGNVVAIPRNAAHPAAALVFIHWLTSSQTQSELNRVYGSAPQHPQASDAFSLLSAKERQKSTDWANKKLSDAIKAGFINEVSLHD
ncbi:extracellular solute-binding protein [Vibrio salinus]|uniref:extracellular solute-binding protein n=1 Tax=Vibrio salinus TaxID=2899784 RepID=UPI001E286474|nr:extracellular solute-binding protein [Vibrio salinus]MCE0495163.1 extracellular solute-binding protein [Vibrio salinus]